MTNLVSNSGVVASDVSGVGTNRGTLGASSYGGDKALFAFGVLASGAGNTNLKNLVNNSGVVAADVTGVGTSRYGVAAAGYSYSA